MRNGLMTRINADPKLKQAYEILVKDVPEEQRGSHGADGPPENASSSRSQAQQQTRGRRLVLNDDIRRVGSFHQNRR